MQTTSNHVLVDQWVPEEKDMRVKCPWSLVAPLREKLPGVTGLTEDFDCFVLLSKKCYKSPAMKHHLSQYINYFCKFYDQDEEYFSILIKLKFQIDRMNTYNVDQFFFDMTRFILYSPTLRSKINAMVDDNYQRNLHYTNVLNTTLQYTDKHAKALHVMSMLMVLTIPLLTHYYYIHKVDISIDDYLLQFFSNIMTLDGDSQIYEKLYNTAVANTASNQEAHKGIWAMQDIRGIDLTSHSLDSVNNIILNIMPKYTFESSIISFNYYSIRRNTGFKITDIAFEHNYLVTSSSNRDKDSVSDFDKYEAGLIRMNEGLSIQNDQNKKYAMRVIEEKFGPFDPVEIDHYTRRILFDESGNLTMNPFQRQLIFNLFSCYFGDPQSIHSIDRIEYIKLILSAKKYLLSKGMRILAYIISSRVNKFVQRKTVNKKEMMYVKTSPLYPRLVEKYQNDRVIDIVFSMLATIISSEFSLVDMNPDRDGKILTIYNHDLIAIVEEVESFVLLC